MSEQIMKYRFEAWADDEGVTFAPDEGIKWQKNKGLMGKNSKFLYAVDADTPEEAMAVHHVKMGWEPYKPGAPKLCPKGCGSYFYPEGSGECPKCGKIC